MSLARAIPPVLGALLTAAAVAAGCAARDAHILEAYVYDPANDCLDAPAIIDVVAGPVPTAACERLRCWLTGGGLTAVTDAACDVPPDYQDETDAGTGPCVKALAAYAQKGHQLCPTPPDAGSATGS